MAACLRRWGWAAWALSWTGVPLAKENPSSTSTVKIHVTKGRKLLLIKLQSQYNLVIAKENPREVICSLFGASYFQSLVLQSEHHLNFIPEIIFDCRCICSAICFLLSLAIYWLIIAFFPLPPPLQAYPCTNDKECEVGKYCHSPHQATSACMICRRKKRRCHRDGMCCPGNRCNNGTCSAFMLS